MERNQGFWTIHARVSSGGKHEDQIFTSAKVVVASGLTSLPNLPRLPHRDKFKGSIVHHKDFGRTSRSLLKSASCQNAVVLGGGKSATDMVYESIKKGKHVDWIIRKSGEGPALYFPAPGDGKRYQSSLEKGSTRLAAAFSPSSFMPRNLWLAPIIHGTEIGRKYLDQRVRGVDEGCRRLAAYTTRDGAMQPSFQNLECTTT